jgi:hypothetical protein
MKRKQKEDAIVLRKQGASLRDISQKLNVSKGSVSLWVRDVNLSQEQKERLFTNRVKNLIKGGHANSKECREKREAFQEEGYKKAKENDSDHKAMCMLYWAEGTKSKNQVTFTNSDVFMMRYFIKLLKSFFVLTEDDIKMSIKTHIDNGLSVKDIENYWLDNIGLPRKCLQKTFIDYRRVNRNKDFKKKTLYYGVCSIMVYKTNVVQHIYGAIQEYADCKKEEWLDRRW